MKRIEIVLPDEVYAELVEFAGVQHMNPRQLAAGIVLREVSNEEEEYLWRQPVEDANA